MTTTHTLVNGDSRHLSLLPDQSVHLIVTSPPYWQLKDYGSEGQIGFHDSYEDYINNLNLVWKECYRVLHDGCRMCINIGDQFARSVYYGRYKVIPIRTEIIRFCETLGMDYMGAVIWRKQTTMHTTGGGVVMGSFPYPRNGIMKIDYEFILIFKKQGKAPTVGIDEKRQSEMTKEEWNTYFASHWVFGGAKQDGHIAVFPEELPRRLIKMFSFVGETVFDPFMGSGTTALAARNLQRNSVGYEINPDFKEYYERKVAFASLFDAPVLRYLRDDSPVDLPVLMSRLPYRFRDPHKLDSKIDIKQLQFGSKIDKDSKEREEYFYVKTVLSANTAVLSNGLRVRLLGVKGKPTADDNARNFLAEKTAGHKVFMRYDVTKYDNNNLMLCYLYLDNRMFLNAHLIKSGLADIDYTFDFKYKSKFEKLLNG